LPGLLAWLLRGARERNRSKKRERDPYRAFVIGPDGLAIGSHTILSDHDNGALEQATQLQGELPIELWFGSRKVADIPAISLSREPP
jgi:hypothetical protein